MPQRLKDNVTKNFKCRKKKNEFLHYRLKNLKVQTGISKYKHKLLNTNTIQIISVIF